jgi:PAS domain S-box-containing protein
MARNVVVKVGARSSRGGRGARIGAQRRILLVDDDPLQLKLAHFLLTDLGFQVSTAKDAGDGLAQLRRGGFEAVLSDVLMPQPDGFRFCDEIRNDSAIAHLPVVLLSSNFVDSADREVARRVGASAMIERTPRLTEAVAALDHAMRQPVQPASVGLEHTEYSDRMLRQLDRQVLLNDVAARRAAMHVAIMKVISGISQTLTRRQDLAVALPEVLADLLTACGLTSGALFMPVATRHRYEVAASLGLSPAQIAHIHRHGTHSSIVADVVDAMEPVVIEASAGTPEIGELLAELGGASGLLVPLVADGACLGMLLLLSPTNDLLEPAWLAFAAGMGTQIGQAFALSQTMAKLVASEVGYRRIMETTSEGVGVVDAEGKLSFVNPRLASILGCATPDVLGQAFVAFLDAPGVAAFERDALEHAAGRPAQSELRFVRPDGTAVWAIVGSSPIVDASGRPGGCLATVMDITERRLADAAHEATTLVNASLQSQLQESQKMEAVGRLAAGIAHDFNNILSVILSYGEMLLGDVPEDGTMHDDLDEIVRAGRRAATLTRQLLMFSHQQVIAPRVLDLNEQLQEFHKLVGRVIGADVHVVLSTEKDLGRIYGDPGSVDHVILNLVLNAREAMPTGGALTIETKNVVLDATYALAHLGVKAGPYVLVAVSDTGCGMDETTKARIFDPFFTTKARGKRTGLGLATVFGIVEQLRGSIHVTSELGRGTCVAIYIPAVDVMPERDGTAEAIHDSLRGTETILVVEDDDQVRAVARAILRKYGYQVIEASSAGEALAISRGAVGIDLLLSDVVMPQMSGPELAKRLAPGHPAMKILCMSGYTDDSIVRHGVLEGGLAFLQKPLTTEALTRKIRDLLDQA